MGKYNPCADIRAASHAMRRRFDSLDIGKPSGLTPSQCRIMGFIMDNGDKPRISEGYRGGVQYTKEHRDAAAAINGA
ncbi:MAG: hypothetical protein V8Q81_05645 [Christensenellales bacterium]